MKKKLSALLMVLSFTMSANAQSLKSDMNTILNDYALPMFLAVMVLAALIGIMKNWTKITSENSEGDKKEGWMNVVYIVGYVIVAVTVIAFVVSKISAVSISI